MGSCLGHAFEFSSGALSPTLAGWLPKHSLSTTASRPGGPGALSLIPRGALLVPGSRSSCDGWFLCTLGKPKVTFKLNQMVVGPWT